jgi:hypothetical protein
MSLCVLSCHSAWMAGAFFVLNLSRVVFRSLTILPDTAHVVEALMRSFQVVPSEDSSACLAASMACVTSAWAISACSVMVESSVFPDDRAAADARFKTAGSWSALKSIINSIAAKFAMASSVGSLRTIVAEGRPRDPGLGVGVTSYIKHSLRNSKPFNRKNPFSNLKMTVASRRGLAAGRRLDSEIRDFVDNNNPTATTRLSARAQVAISKLRGAGVVVAAAQVIARDTTLGIKSYIDAIGVGRSRNVVVIELKSTMLTVAQHEQLYRKPAGSGLLANGMSDTEQVHHFLQAGFGAHALGATYPRLRAEFPGGIAACVLVSCTDGARIYTVPPSYCCPLAFTTAPSSGPAKGTASKAKRAKKSKLKKWPTGMFGLSEALAAGGYAVARVDGPCAHLTPIKSGGSAVAVVVQSAQERKLAAAVVQNAAPGAQGFAVVPDKSGSFSFLRL